MPRPKQAITQRHEFILQVLRKDGLVSVPGIASDFGMSEMTVRRDLDKLAERNLLIRIHGGAKSLQHFDGLDVDLVEPSFDERTAKNRRAKAAIAQCALQLVEENQTIALDIGTTVFELAHQLRDLSVRVVTSSLKIAGYLAQSRASVYVPGGQVSGTEPSVIGADAAEHLRSFLFDTAFLGVSGLTADGFYDYSLEDTAIKKVLIGCAQKSVVLLDSSKFERLSVVKISTLERIDVLVTDTPPPVSLHDALDAAGVQVEVAQVENA